MGEEEDVSRKVFQSTARTPAMGSSRVDAVGRDTIRRRILAYIADATFVVGAVTALRSTRSTGRRIAVGIAISGIVAVPYHVFLEGATGQTLGKKLFRIAVVRESGEPCTYRAAAIRTAFRVVDWLPAGYLVGLTSMVVTGRRQRLGDLAAGTVVVSEGGPLAERGDRATPEENTPCT